MFQKCYEDLINPFVPNVTFLYPLKKLENVTVFCCSLRFLKSNNENKWIKAFLFFKAFQNDAKTNPNSIFFFVVWWNGGKYIDKIEMQVVGRLSRKLSNRSFSSNRIKMIYPSYANDLFL